MAIFIGCAGWNLRKEFAEHFPCTGTHLERYAGRMNAVEINSSFYRSHRPSSYGRWAASTPDYFRFSVKLPRQITHVDRLCDVSILIEHFRSETANLGSKLGPVLVQLPPSLEFDKYICESFLEELRARIAGPIVFEPRHASWFDAHADDLMKAYAIGRVAADPSIVAQAAEIGGCPKVCYFRWHGSPHVYHSSYGNSQLNDLANRIQSAATNSTDVWCIFDNTAQGAAIANALSLAAILEQDLPLGVR